MLSFKQSNKHKDKLFSILNNTSFNKITADFFSKTISAYLKASALARKNKHLLVVNNKDALIKSIGRDADADADAESIYSIEITCNER